jgi:hypothetical protein
MARFLKFYTMGEHHKKEIRAKCWAKETVV